MFFNLNALKRIKEDLNSVFSLCSFMENIKPRKGVIEDIRLLQNKQNTNPTNLLFSQKHCSFHHPFLGCIMSPY